MIATCALRPPATVKSELTIQLEKEEEEPVDDNTQKSFPSNFVPRNFIKSNLENIEIHIMILIINNICVISSFHRP